MAHRTGQNRQQFGLFATPLDEMIASDNMVRVTDAFVDAIGCQKPSYHTISDFRSIKPHRKALKATFRIFNQVLDGARLFGKELDAIDGTKISAHNSKKNNISEGKIIKRLEHHESRFMA
ncbi:MAG: hypothetical protein IPK76_22550 [Lewinellaceae bacterium]|nr:hypothetical protein [Lewinellaceae bacterium]